MEIHKVIDVLMHLFERYRTYLIITVSTLLGAIGLMVYVYISNTQYNYASQQALSELLLEYDRAHASAELWNEVEIGAKTAYRQYGKASVAPYFLMMQAEALYQQHKQHDALALMEQSLASIAQTSSLYYMFALKLAQMQLAQEETAVHEKGLQALISLAHDEKNQQRDSALYQLAEYYHMHNEQEKAEKIRKELLALKPLYKDVMSPWISLMENHA